MSIFQAIKKCLSTVSVTERQDTITIRGYHSRFVTRDLKRIWATSKIASHMFTELSGTKIVFPSFFALEVEYMFQRMLDDRGNAHNRRLIKRVLERLRADTWLSCRDDQYQDILDIKKTRVIKFNLLPEQVNFLNYYNHTVPRYNLRGAMLSAAPGAGKAQPLTAMFKTPDGWVRNGSVEIGTMLSMPDGSVAPVIGVYPQGNKDVYKVTFEDGRSTECCIEHLWSVLHTVNGHQRGDTLTTRDVMELMRKDNATIHVQLPAPVDTPHVDYVVSPYTMGYAMVSVSDDEWKRELGVSKKTGIPADYLNGSIEQRMELMRGLLNFNASIVSGKAELVVTMQERVLANQMVDLARGLGCIASCQAEANAYTVSLQHPQLFKFVTTAKLRNELRRRCTSLNLKLTSIVRTGESKPMQCVMVDHPDHLYITDNYIVTHNTIADIATMLGRDKEVVFVISPKKAIYDVWEKTLLENVSGNQTVWVADRNVPCPKGTRWRIFHYQRLEEAVKMAAELARTNTDIGVVLDESHNMNNAGSAQTRNFIELCKVSNSQDILWASGTPIKALGAEAIPLFHTIIPNFNEAAAQAIKKIWGKSSTAANEILAHRLGVVSFSVPKSRFMTDKPIEATVKISIPNGNRYTLETIKGLMRSFIEERFKYYKARKPEYQDIYDEALRIYTKAIGNDPSSNEKLKQYRSYVTTFVKQGYDPRTMSAMSQFCNKFELEEIVPSLPQGLRAPFKDARSVIKYVDLKIKGECLGRILGRERTQCHVDMVASIPFETYIDNAEKKTLIFTDFVPVLEETKKRTEEIGYIPVVVYGDTNSQLVQIIKEFRADQDINPLIATFRSLAEAVPVTEANTGLMLNKPFRFHHYAQAVSRMHRIGQDTTVYVYNFVLDTGNEPNISTRSEDIMDWSKQQVDQLMGLNRYGTIADMPDTMLDDGMESLGDDDKEHIENGFLSAGNEALYNDMESLGLIVEQPCELTAASQRPSALAW